MGGERRYLAGGRRRFQGEEGECRGCMHKVRFSYCLCALLWVVQDELGVQGPVQAVHWRI